ncbi:translation initiation factor, aIF-2BI family [Thermoanaerobacter mathranii subsp. mathranii str. A3]|uniref:Methylthioribose-1-phosphate isomerase n=2 Tax=Thermoanaerobacter TaxID=1754 RepID=A0ABT9M3R1_9THEO|nr:MULTISPECIES: S-methyl-5-thioribose-1-phosphate isomerase [Thermoanaerobacter]ADH61139.1 translation initiation factor, aIF-2BI family [Thermoanaerobacter mathranii subsp. mathranii str. A3]MBT1278864.1 S-methyl-5-thioribose-1-phosphate isomerase [Thermoanaerobacter sp. CM-CNRG TB177]MDP9750751.1 methylthioribose-1-phosphate isomerase [Thermoanaerobacter pentosaceus]
MKDIKSIEFKDEILYLIDQRKLPNSYEIFECKTYSDVNFSIKEMIVRGAPAIGAAAAYGVVLAAKEFLKEDREIFFKKMEEALEVLINSRPTAVNLMWAVKRMKKVIEKNKELELIDIYQALKKEADSIYLEDIETNKKMAKFGNEVIKENAVILTHCNTGALATVGYGTALGVIREAHYSGKNIFVYVDETRPRLQGSKLTAWELVQEGIPAKLIADSVAATLIRDGKIDVILVGADRIALNGDTANKIGTFMLSVIAKVYNVPFYVVAPTSTIDFEIESGKEIVIEERSPEEITHINGVRIAPEGIEVYNPAFDVTPHENITGIITEKGIIRPPFKENILKLRS